MAKRKEKQLVKMYAIAYCVQGKGTARFGVIVTLAKNEEEALGVAYKSASVDAPTNKGYHAPDLQLVEIPDSKIQEYLEANNG